MNNLISLPTGRTLENPNFEIKKYFSKFDLDGIELTMLKKERLYNFKLNKEDKLWLKDLDYVSLHAPNHIISEAKDKKEQIKQLDLLCDLYNKVDAKTIVFHPHQFPEILAKKYDWKIFLENMSFKNYLDNNVVINGILKSKYSFCLDTAHATDFGIKEIERLYNLLEHKLSQIHLSSQIKKVHHCSLTIAPKIFMNSLKPILKTNVPLVLEIDDMWKNKASVNKEIKYAKELFN